MKTIHAAIAGAFLLCAAPNPVLAHEGAIAWDAPAHPVPTVRLIEACRAGDRLACEAVGRDVLPIRRDRLNPSQRLALSDLRRHVRAHIEQDDMMAAIRDMREPE